MVWACDAKGRDPYNKKHVEHDGDGNPTQRTSKDEMAWQAEKWHAHLWHQPRDGHWQRTLGCHGETRRHHLDGRRRKRLVKVSKLYCLAMMNAPPSLWLSQHGVTALLPPPSFPTHLSSNLWAHQVDKSKFSSTTWLTGDSLLTVVAESIDPSP